MMVSMVAPPSFRRVLSRPIRWLSPPASMQMPIKRSGLFRLFFLILILILILIANRSSARDFRMAKSRGLCDDRIIAYEAVRPPLRSSYGPDPARLQPTCLKPGSDVGLRLQLVAFRRSHERLSYD